ncbi:MAG: hypothetical protein QXK94_09840 [Candidatus Jordarchaeales archaeon]
MPQTCIAESMVSPYCGVMPPTIPDTTVDVANTSLTSPHYLMVLVPQ